MSDTSQTIAPPPPDAPAPTNRQQEENYLREVNARPLPGRIQGYIALSGPGWLQSAITLGGGSLASGLYLGVLSGFAMLWLQPLAMILGIIMLSAIGYITLSTGERPFRAINRHVSPVLGWGWLIGSQLANMVWALPQYSLATGVLRQNLLPDLLGTSGPLTEFQSTLLIVGTILAVSTIITWSYGSGHWGVRLYEWMLKLVVGLIVVCFVGVVIRLGLRAEGFDWNALWAGFIPDFGALFHPADSFVPLLAELPSGARAYWEQYIVARQRDVVMSAFATAVGINMTFLLPYSLLARGWGRAHRGLSVFDLCTGMFVPFVLATSCVVIAAASQFHAVPQAGLDPSIDATINASNQLPATGKQQDEFAKLIDNRIKRDLADGNEVDWTDPAWAGRLQAARGGVSNAEKRLAATLVTRDVSGLSIALEPLLGSRLFAQVIFGLGALGMALSSITLLMLISGFVVCEVLDVPATGWPLRLGSLLPAVGALGPFVWTQAAAWLAVPTSVFCLALLPIAYLAFFLLMNQRRILKDQMPRGVMRIISNLLMGLATAVALGATGWVIWTKVGPWGLAGIGVLLAMGFIVRRPAISRGEGTG